MKTFFYSFITIIFCLGSTFKVKAQGDVKVTIQEVTFSATGQATHVANRAHCVGDQVWYNIVSDHYDNFKTRVSVTNGTIVNYIPSGNYAQVVSPTEVVLLADGYPNSSFGYDQAFVQVAWNSSTGNTGDLHAVVYYHYFGFASTQTATGDYNQGLFRTTDYPATPQGTYVICGTNTVTIPVSGPNNTQSYQWFAQDASVRINGQAANYYSRYSTTSNSVQVTVPAGATEGSSYIVNVNAIGPCGSSSGITSINVRVSCAVVSSPPNVSFVTSPNGTSCQPRYNVRVGRSLYATSYTATLQGNGIYANTTRTITADPYAYYMDIPFDIAGPVNGIAVSVTASSPNGTSAPTNSGLQNLAGGNCGYRGSVAPVAALAQPRNGKMYPNPALDQVTLEGIALDGVAQQAQAIFYDSKGARCKLVTLRAQDAQTTVNLRELPAGLYHVRIMAKGKVLTTTQLVLQH